MEVSSLSRLCLESTADNMAMWCESALKEDFFKYMYAIGPFNGLNSSMIQQLLDIAYRKQALKASYLPILIHGSITNLNFSLCHSMITDQVLKLLQLRCKKLAHLNLGGCTRLSGRCLNEVLPNLSSLKNLNLSHCPGCSDGLFKEFGKRRLNIHELLVEACPRISDTGVKALMNGNHSDRCGCLSIRHLNLSSTSVTTKSLWSILKQLPRLKKLSFSNIEYGKEEESLSFLDDIHFLELEFLDVSGTYISGSNVKTLCKKCPKLVDVKMNYSDELSDGFLQHLICLSRLKSLDIGGAFPRLGFEHLALFLKEHGHQLESVDLSGMTGVQVSVLCLYCKSLQHLVLADCKDVDASLPTWDMLTEEQRKHLTVNKETGALNVSSFYHLRFLNLNRSTFNTSNPVEIQRELLFRFLTSICGLQKLLLKSVNGVDDEVMDRILESSSRETLCRIDLTDCQNITMTTVYKILERCCNLRSLNLSNCRHVGLGDISKIKAQLKRAGNPLEIIWI